MGPQRQGRHAHVACSPPGGGSNLPPHRRLRAAERDVRACHELSSVSHRVSFTSARCVPRCACLPGAREGQEVVVIAASQVHRHRDSCRQASQGGQVVRSQQAEGDRLQAERPYGRGWASPDSRRICGCSDTRDGWRSAHGSARSARVGTWSTSQGAGRRIKSSGGRTQAASRSFSDRKGINHDNPFVVSGSVDSGPGGGLHGDSQPDGGYGWRHVRRRRDCHLGLCKPDRDLRRRDMHRLRLRCGKYPLDYRDL